MPYLQKDRTALGGFLRNAGIPENVPITALPMDASRRYYYRLEGEKKLVMVCPSSEKPEQFTKMSALLNDMDLCAPKVLAVEGDFYLVEDFGNTTYSTVLKDENRKDLYMLAVDVLLHIKEKAIDKPNFLHAFTPQVLLDEVMVFTQWYKDGLTQNAKSFRDIWHALLETVDVPHTLILRDYHKDNLFYLQGNNGLRACGLIDFQDAVWGPVTYDLVSLINDARVDVPDDLRTYLRTRYFDAFPRELHAKLDHASQILDMQRQLRILGVFKRLSLRDGKHHYLNYIPRILSYVTRGLEYLPFRPLQQWIQDHDVL
ncbi:MAG: phosphotransferase [Alphaproteobacteria bacterium]|nr:phosphotransferase [Alphaproteobacteria bacterium]